MKSRHRPLGSGHVRERRDVVLAVLDIDLASPSMQERNGAYVQRRAARPRTPEELSTQLEDALIVRDLGGLAELFDEHAVLSPCDSHLEVRGSDEIAAFAAAHRAADRSYLARIRRVVQAGATAAMVVDLSGEHGRGVDVLRRGSDGVWRYVISLLQVCERSRGGEPCT